MTDKKPKKRYKVIYDREGCIGAAACAAVFPERWEIVEDGKADLKGGEPKEDNLVQEVEFDDEELEKMMASAESCPVNVIHIIDLETGEKLI